MKKFKTGLTEKASSDLMSSGHDVRFIDAALSTKIEVLPMTHYLNGVKMGDSATNVAYAGQQFEAEKNEIAVWIDLPDGRACYFGLGEEGQSFKFV